MRSASSRLNSFSARHSASVFIHLGLLPLSRRLMLTVGRWRILIDQFEAARQKLQPSFRSASGQTSPDFGKRAKRASDNGIDIYLIASISASAAAVGPPLRLLRSVALRAGSRSNKATTAGIDIARILRRFVKHLPCAPFCFGETPSCFRWRSIAGGGGNTCPRYCSYKPRPAIHSRASSNASRV